MIFLNAYDTTVGSMTDLRITEKMLKEALIKDLSYMNNFGLNKVGDISPVFITGYGSSESVIPFFSHPLLIDSGKDQKFLFADIRPFMRQKSAGERPSEVDVKNVTEFAFSKSRMVLSLAWLAGMVGGIKNDLSFAGMVYANWLSEVISKKYGLDPKDQLVVTIVAHYFYQSLFEKEVDEHVLQKFAVQTAKVTKAPTSMIFEVFDRAGKLSDLKSFCSGVISASENVRLHDFNVGMLMSIISNSWYGHNSRDIIPVGLEHPPTWCAIVYMALTERTYKNFMIARVCERIAKYGNGDGFTKAYASYVQQFTQHVGVEELVIRDFVDD